MADAQSMAIPVIILLAMLFNNLFNLYIMETSMFIRFLNFIFSFVAILSIET